ncbi:MAG TPA: glycosyltransferase family A protein [Solirubrobacterales bacterium]|nr:glycosyltransferase family A protein [Solirubrobacterales bacterium]
MEADDGTALAVDIVVNNYNYGRFLPAAIESALAQTHPRVNLIVVDDGSTDDSRERLHQYEDRATVVLKENGGQSSALNAGLERCRGDVVIFLDADDLLAPVAAAQAAAAFAADPAVVKVQARMEVIDETGSPTGELKPPEHLPLPSGDVSQAELAGPFDLTWLPTSANAFRTESLAPIRPIPGEDLRVGADYFLVHLSALLGRVVSLESVGSYYRVHGGNSYEPQRADLDLAQLRLTIELCQATSEQLLRTASRLGIPHPARILSIADLGNRMISLRLAPEQHPIPSDTRAGLLADAVRAARRRQGVGLAMKTLFVLWFAAMALAPRALARGMAERFLFPTRRSGLNRLLKRLHRPRPR